MLLKFEIEAAELFSAVLYNSGDTIIADTGALDLDLGLTKDLTDTLVAEIYDIGIDTLIATGENWFQKIAPMPGSELRTPGISYDSVERKFDVKDAFNKGVLVAGTSSKLEGGEEFVVRNFYNAYYILKVDTVVQIPDSNKDYYKISYKM